MPLDFPASPSLNDTYTYGDKTWIWNGQGWALNPSGNVTANNISVIGNVTASYYFGNGTQLVGVPNTTVSSSPPSSPEQGDIWIDSDTAVQLIYFNDGNSSQWAEMEAQTSFTTEALPQNITATTVVATGNITAGNLLTSGLISATGNLTAGNLTTPGLISATGNITAGNLLTAGSASVSSITKTGTDGAGNIGQSTNTFDTVFAKATSAAYADLAEMYESDQVYQPGTVVIFGGAKEITQSTENHDDRIAGVVSSDPAFIMNSGSNGIAVALTGRVPCRVLGPVSKGDMLVSSDVPGVAQCMQHWRPGAIIGKSLVDSDDNSVRMVEIVVGRL